MVPQILGSPMRLCLFLLFGTLLACGPGSEQTTPPPTDVIGIKPPPPPPQPLPIGILSPTPGEFVGGPISLAFKLGTLPIGNTSDLALTAYLDGVPVPQMDKLASEGFVQLNLDSRDLKDGKHRVRLDGEHPNYLHTTAQTVFTVDNSKPLLEFDNPPNDLIANSDVKVMVKYADAVSGVSSVQIRLDGSTIFEKSDLGGIKVHGSMLVIPYDELSKETHTVTAIVTDMVGNSISASRNFRVLQRPPFYLSDIYLPPGSGSVHSAALVDVLGSAQGEDERPELLASTGSSLVLYPNLEDGKFGNASEVLIADVSFFETDDRNGDGWADLVAIESSTTGHSLSVFIATPHDSKGVVYLPSVTGSQEIEGVVVALNLGDFNEDGIQDALITTDAEEATLSVLLGTEEGGFSEAKVFGGIYKSVDAHVTDVDQDDHLDVVVRRAGLNMISVYRGDGSGTFGIAVDTLFNEIPLSSTVTDIDGNDIPDLLLTVVDADHVPLVEIYRGLGDGSFELTSTAQGWGEISQVVAADENGDGTLDLIGLSKDYRNVEVWHQTAGLFGGSEHILYQAGYTPKKLIVGDVNQDGKADPVVIGLDAIVVLRSEEEYPRHGVREYPIIGSAADTVSTRVNPDGALDFVSMPTSSVIVSKSGIANITINTHVASPLGILNNPLVVEYDLELEEELSASTTLGVPDQILAPDLDGDGIDDLIFRLPPESGQDSLPNIFALTRLGQSFEPFDSMFIPGDISDMVAANMLGPAFTPHILMTTSTEIEDETIFQLQIYETLGNKLTLRGSQQLWAAGTDIEVVDVNDDGFLDVFVLQPDLGNVAYLRGIGAGLVMDPVMYAVGESPELIRLAEVNGDGHIDLVITNSTGILIAAGRGNGDFDPPETLALSATNISSLVVHDLTGDGFMDFIGASSSEGNLLMQMSLLDGTYGYFTRVATSPDVGDLPSGGVFVGDTNGDGCDDVTTVGTHSSVLVQYLHLECLTP